MDGFGHIQVQRRGKGNAFDVGVEKGFFMSKVLTKEKFFEKGKALAQKRERLPIPELGGDVFVRVMTGNERDAMEDRFSGKGRTMVGARAYIAASTVCDASGLPLFDMNGDLAALGKMPGSVMTSIFEVSSRLNRFTDEDIEDLEKNSESAPSDDSGSI